jgi:predicted RecB family endonuclease
MSTRNLGMVLLASEQLWPNIQSLVHWRDQLKCVCIYYTDDQRRSKQPALRLKEFCEKYIRDATIVMPHSPLGMQPADVTKQLGNWIQHFNGLKWILNATGGTKLMTAGVLRLTGEPGAMVVYKELTSGWFELLRDPDGRAIMAQPLNIPPCETDAVPVSTLLETFWGGEGWQVDVGIRPRRLPVVDIIRVAAENQWNWRRAFEERKIPLMEGREQSGFLFEELVAAILLEMGVRNMVCNVSRKSVQGGVVQEVDIVANHGGCLNIIDCKLRAWEDEARGKVESITSQLRQAAHTRRELGGLGARLLLLRPNRSLNETERQLAEAYQLEVIDAQECSTVITKLARFFGINQLNETLQQAEKIIDEAVRKNLVPRLGAASPLIEMCERASKINQIINLDVLSEDIAREGGKQWVAYFCPPDLVFIRCKCAAEITTDAIQQRVEHIFSKWSHGPCRIERSTSQSTCYIFIRADVSFQYGQIRDKLQQYVGRSLFNS